MNEQKPDEHWSFRSTREDLDIDRILREADEAGGEIVIIDSEHGHGAAETLVSVFVRGEALAWLQKKQVVTMQARSRGWCQAVPWRCAQAHLRDRPQHRRTAVRVWR
jgi:hypothetical protein